MIVCENSVRIDRPVEAVFAYVAQGFFKNLKAWNPDLVELVPEGDQIVRKGARAREAQVIQGNRFDRTIEVTDFEPPKVFAIKSLGSTQQPTEHAVSRFSFSTDGSGARLEYRFELEWQGFMYQSIPWLPKFFINKALSKNLGTMKKVLEGENK